MWLELWLRMVCDGLKAEVGKRDLWLQAVGGTRLYILTENGDHDSVFNCLTRTVRLFCFNIEVVGRTMKTTPVVFDDEQHREETAKPSPDAQ